jgi:type VI protein secretion system component VasF
VLLSRLHAGLRGALADLLAALASLGVPEREISQVIEPLAIFTDERVLLRLPPEAAMSYGRLEYDLHQSNDGGLRFYQNADHLLRPGASELAREVYAFCLNEGFAGALADDRPRLQHYRDAFAQTILASQPPAAPAPVATPAQGIVPPSIWQAADRTYYLVATAVGVALAAGIVLFIRAVL